ncbi:alpha/beta hydrolase [Endozoicomonas sp. OPT23]|uniref:alpha/beta family hydrolase n=1 Tax=Endozoicomonas sp. OPT23 TaxID=2072845 RepID=UPI00129A4B20|nr:alpha/beta family hydrolase [Endozoicomonas sp. OPT23]MRI34011.1 alpha/beta hydrolase [Endozoicomonas sp. OPT23]
MRWNKVRNPLGYFVFAHGAGAPMDSEFMEIMVSLLTERDISVVRFEFPYMQERRETGKKRPPDRQPKLLAYWQEVLDKVKSQTNLPVFIGGKSMGGRMATLLTAEGAESSGIICLGYPFYAANKQDKPRTEHLEHLATPTLIIQGERDTMGNTDNVTSYQLSEQISIEWLTDGNHDLKPRKVSGFTHQQHLESAADKIAHFIRAKI